MNHFQAIVAQLGMTCPLCTGAGVVPRGVHEHYAPVLAKHAVRKCDGCGAKQTLPRDLLHLGACQRVFLIHPADQQQAIAQQVDLARDAPGVVVDRGKRVLAERRVVFPAGHLECVWRG